MTILFVLAATVFIENSCSQTLSKSPDCLSVGNQLTLTCETTDLLQGINFNLDGVDQGGCVPSVGCAAGITQSGTTTILIISSFDVTLNSGSWKCTYGGSTSTAVTIATNVCNSSSEEGLSRSVQAGIGCGCWFSIGVIAIVIFLLSELDVPVPAPVTIVLLLLFSVIAIIVFCILYICIWKERGSGDPSSNSGDTPSSNNATKMFQVKEGEPVTLFPDLTQNNIISVEWRHGGLVDFRWPLQDGNNGNVIQDIRGTIANVSEANGGEWQCSVKDNNNTQKQYTFVLTVT